ncbi:MAG: lipid II flippase MurJ [Patescibacteria group bacterium]
MGRLHKIFSWKSEGLSRTVLLLAFATGASQVLALLRDRLLAGHFGAGRELDIYYAAFKVPDFLFATVGSLISLSVLVPYLARVFEQSEEVRKRFLSSVFTVFSFGMLIVSAIAFFLMPFITRIIFPGFDLEATKQTVLLSRILLAQPILLSLSGFFGSINQTALRFVAFAASPILYNLGIIGGILFLVPKLGLMGLAIGVVVGAFFHFLATVPFVVAEGHTPRLSKRIDFGLVRAVASKSLVRSLAFTSIQLVTTVFVSIASTFHAGAITLFTMAYNLQSVPLSAIGGSYSVATFPVLSKLFIKNEKGAFEEKLRTSIEELFLATILLSGVAIALAPAGILIIFKSGQFTIESASEVALAFRIFVFSLPAQALILFITRAFYAAGRTLLPVYVNTICAFFTMFLGFAIPMAIGQTGSISLLALAFTIGNLINATALLYLLNRSFPGVLSSFIFRLTRGLFSAITGGLLAFVVYISIVPADSIFSLLLLGTASAVIVGILGSVGMLEYLGFPAFTRIRER